MKKCFTLLLACILFLTIVPASADPARLFPETEEPFLGMWIMDAVYMDGIYVNNSVLEWLAGIVYEGGDNYHVDEAILILTPGQAELRVGLGDAVKTKTSVSSFADGVLSLEDPMGILGEGVQLYLCEDGSLVSEAHVSYGIFGIGVKVFLTPTDHLPGETLDASF